MTLLSPETIWKLNKKELLNMLETGFYMRQNREIRFYAPSFSYYKTKFFCSFPSSFPTISVTGTRCALNCKHCGGKVLETMHPALSPSELFDVCAKLKQKGAVGCLVSGGCLPDGSVPLEEFADAIEKVKRELGLTVFVHTGVITPKTAAALKKAGVDAALIDVISSSETIKKTLSLNITPQDYVDSLQALDKSKLNFVPHVIVGLKDGKLDGELDALRMVAAVKPSAVVLIAFMPIRGTAMEKTTPPKPWDIAKVTAAARMMFPKVPLILGCMRPKGKARGETDVLALKAGVDAIAFPSEEAVKCSNEKGWKTSFSSFCCAQMYLDVAIKNTK